VFDQIVVEKLRSKHPELPPLGREGFEGLLSGLAGRSPDLTMPDPGILISEATTVMGEEKTGFEARTKATSVQLKGLERTFSNRCIPPLPPKGGPIAEDSTVVDMAALQAALRQAETMVVQSILHWRAVQTERGKAAGLRIAKVGESKGQPETSVSASLLRRKNQW